MTGFHFDRLGIGGGRERAVENLRLEAARFLLEQGRLPIETIALDIGFGDRERMRRSFLRVHGQAPQSIRKMANPLAAI
jgi:transcriptional regulator GlxA family with amidase domain